MLESIKIHQIWCYSTSLSLLLRSIRRHQVWCANPPVHEYVSSNIDHPCVELPHALRYHRLLKQSLPDPVDLGRSIREQYPTELHQPPHLFTSFIRSVTFTALPSVLKQLGNKVLLTEGPRKHLQHHLQALVQQVNPHKQYKESPLS